MKIPRNIDAGPGTKAHDSVAPTAANGSPEFYVSDTETLRVLEVRPPTRGRDGADAHGDDDAYAVQFEERVRPGGSKPRAAAVPPLTLEATVARAPAPAAKPAQPATRIPADPPKDVASRDYYLDSVDASSTTGVRHLRIEVERKRKVAPPKPSAGRRKP
jgi:hypothetical protein